MLRLVLCLFSLSAFAATDVEWETAVQRLEAGKAAEAIPLFENWIAHSETLGIRSPQGFHNLAAAYLGAQQPGRAVYPLATSALLRMDPLYGWQAAADLTRIQHQLLIQDAVSAQWPFRLAVLLRPGLLYALGIFGLWVGLFAFWVKTLRVPGMVVGVMCMLLATGGFAVRSVLPPFGVVIPSVQGAALQSEADASKAKKLAELPLGTLVVLGAVSGDGVSISAPFAGWLPKSSVRVLEEH